MCVSDYIKLSSSRRRGCFVSHCCRRRRRRRRQHRCQCQAGEESPPYIMYALCMRARVHVNNLSAQWAPVQGKRVMLRARVIRVFSELIQKLGHGVRAHWRCSLTANWSTGCANIYMNIQHNMHGSTCGLCNAFTCESRQRHSPKRRGAISQCTLAIVSVVSMCAAAAAATNKACHFYFGFDCLAH